MSELPSFSTEAMLKAHRKNAAALTDVNQVAFDGLKTFVQRYGALVQTTVNDYSKLTSGVLAATSFEERAARQADAARLVYVSTVAQIHELYDLAVKTNVAAVDILSTRATVALDETLALFSAAIAPASPTDIAPTSVIAEPVSAVSDVASVGNAVTPIDPETIVTAAPTTGSKTTAPEAEGGVTEAPKAASTTATSKAAVTAASTAVRKTAGPKAKAGRRPTSRG